MKPTYFLEPEIRSDFLVDIKRKKIWSVQIDLLEALLRVCEKHGLTCFCVAGTMLGAVRHAGYIPWDDDIDVAFPRADFEVLCRIAPDEFKHPLFFQYALSDRNLYEPGARLRNSETTGMIAWQKGHRINHGIYIDILVFDAVPGNALIRKVYYKAIDIWNAVLGCYVPGVSSGVLKRVIRQTVCRCLPFESAYQMLTATCAAMSGTGRMYTYAWHRVFRDEYLWERSAFERIIWMPFEYTSIPVPAGYDVCLRHQYGEYMRLPPVGERGLHHNEKIVFEPNVPYADYVDDKGNWGEAIGQ